MERRKGGGLEESVGLGDEGWWAGAGVEEVW